MAGRQRLQGLPAFFHSCSAPSGPCSKGRGKIHLWVVATAGAASSMFMGTVALVLGAVELLIMAEVCVGGGVGELADCFLHLPLGSKAVYMHWAGAVVDCEFHAARGTRNVRRIADLT